MKLPSKLRGPKLQVKLILLFAVVLLVVPWLGYVQLVEMERLLVQGQENTQRQIASTVAIQLSSRDLFNDLPVQIEDYEHLFAQPLDGVINVDGETLDWGQNLDRISHSFGSGDGSFKLALGEKINSLYGFLQISDLEHVYRDPGNIDINSADHVRISYRNTNGSAEQIALTFSSPGEATSFRLGEDTSEFGSPLGEVGGFLKETNEGVAVEFEFPLALMGMNRDFSISYVDVDDSASRVVRDVIEAQPSSEMDSFYLVVFRSARTMDVIQSLGYVNTRILVVDHQRRTRGEIEDRDMDSSQPQGQRRDLNKIFRALRPILHRVFIGEQFKEPTIEESDQLEQEAIESALGGEPHAVRRISESGAPSILAAHPVQVQGEILGAVVVEQDIENILAFQQTAFGQILLITLLAFIIVIVVALGYSIRLAYRIRKLRRAATRAIDEHGRLTSSSISAEINAGDEIGDLARSIGGMLERLNQHQQFLQRMPRTLRHEINNPLNTVSTSLENLRNTTDPTEQERYLQSARRGVMRIGSIVQNLSDAASLEDSLTNEELSTVNIHELLRGYVANLQATHKDVKFVFRSTNGKAFARVSDFYIEQMLDKIIDNALDFHRPDSPIKVQLERGRRHLRIIVANRGPAFRGNWGTVFNSLVSHRSQQSKLHFGLGLYVVRVIAEFHGGSVRAINLVDGSGVAIAVELPLVAESESPASETRRSA